LVEEGNIRGMYMHASPWSRLPKNYYSCRLFGHFLCNPLRHYRAYIVQYCTYC